MLVKHLQDYLEKFTEGPGGTRRQGGSGAFELHLGLRKRWRNLGQLALCDVDASNLRAVQQTKQRIHCWDRLTITDKNLLNPAAALWQERNRAEVGPRISGRGVVVKNHRNEADGQNQAGGDPPPQLVPHSEEGDLISPALTLPVTAKEVVGQYGNQWAENQFQHGYCCSSDRSTAAVGVSASSGVSFFSDSEILLIGVRKSGSFNSARISAVDLHYM